MKNRAAPKAQTATWLPIDQHPIDQHTVDNHLKSIAGTLGPCDAIGHHYSRIATASDNGLSKRQPTFIRTHADQDTQEYIRMNIPWILKDDCM